MSATGVQLNWAPVIFNSVTLVRITQGSFDQGGSLLTFSGDADIFPTVIVNAMNEPKASFTTGDVNSFQTIAPGTTSTLIGTLKDAKGASSGAVVFTLANAVFESASTSGAHAAYASATGSWQAFSGDGSTNPLTYARA